MPGLEEQSVRLSGVERKQPPAIARGDQVGDVPIRGAQMLTGGDDLIPQPWCRAQAEYGGTARPKSRGHVTNFQTRS